MTEYGFIWKIAFLFYQGFWPRERHIRMLQHLDRIGKES